METAGKLESETEPEEKGANPGQKYRGKWNGKRKEKD